MARYSAGLGACLAGCILFMGCGKGSSLKTVPVAGKVTAAGKPFTKGGSISFMPDKAKGNASPHPAIGDIAASGDFTLKTKDSDGAPAGWYKVIVLSRAPADAKDPYATPKSYIDKVYESQETTPLSVEVKEGQSADAYVIKLH